MAENSKIMLAAWQIFRDAYHYPAVPFASIGRQCFAWALREAHRQARERRRLASIPADIKAARVAALNSERQRASFIASWRQAQNRIAEIDRELSALQAAA